MSDAWFVEGSDEQWSPDLPAPARTELDAAIDRLAELLADPGSPRLHVGLADGTG